MRYRYPDSCILIFSKAPVAGKAKTRLIPQLGEQGAADFSARLTRYTVTQVANSQLCPVKLYCTPDVNHALFNELHEVVGVELKQQQGLDLGMRMANALAVELSISKSVLLIGSDCPAMTIGYLEQALQHLLGEKNMVLGPAEDGGYVLVGQSVLNTDIFKDIKWGSAEVLKQTQQRLMIAGLAWMELASLWDVDRPEDIARAQAWMSAKEAALI